MPSVILVFSAWALAAKPAMHAPADISEAIFLTVMTIKVLLLRFQKVRLAEPGMGADSSRWPSFIRRDAPVYTG